MERTRTPRLPGPPASGESRRSGSLIDRRAYCGGRSGPPTNILARCGRDFRSRRAFMPSRMPPALTVSAPLASPPTQAILDVPLALIDYDGALDWVDATVKAGGRG